MIRVNINLVKGGRNVKNKYIYRKHLREPGKFFLGIILMFIISYFVIALEIVLANNIKDKILMSVIFLVIGVVAVILLSVEFLFIYFILYKRFKKIYVVLTEEEIIYNNAKGEIKIPYESIKALKFPSIKYVGGWMKIIHSNGNIRLTVVLQGIGDMVSNLKNKLDDKNISNVYSDKAIFNFIKTANYSDQSWERIYEYLKHFIIVIFASLGVGAVFSAFIMEIPVKIIVFVGSLLGIIIVYIICEIIFGRKLAKGASKEKFSVPNRDKKFEMKIYKWAFVIYLIIFLIMQIMLIV